MIGLSQGRSRDRGRPSTLADHNRAVACDIRWGQEVKSPADHHDCLVHTVDASQCMVPARRPNLASEVGKLMMIDKERREAREEQGLARKKPPKGAHDGAGGG